MLLISEKHPTIDEKKNLSGTQLFGCQFEYLLRGSSDINSLRPSDA